MIGNVRLFFILTFTLTVPFHFFTFTIRPGNWTCGWHRPVCSRLFFTFTFILTFTFKFSLSLCSWLFFIFTLILTFTFHFHYTTRQLNMWLAMSDVLPAVFHFSAPPPYGRTRAPIKKLLQWSICTLLWQKGTITCLPVELSLLAYRRLEFQNIVCSILSFFFRGHECLVYDLGEDLWLCMMIIQVWISQWPDCLNHEKPKS